MPVAVSIDSDLDAVDQAGPMYVLYKYVCILHVLSDICETGEFGI